MESKQIGVMIGIALVVALAVFLITPNLTGNAVWWKNQARANVNLPSGSITYQGILDMLGNGVIVSKIVNSAPKQIESSCNEVCSDISKTCIDAYHIIEWYPYGAYGGEEVYITSAHDCGLVINFNDVNVEFPQTSLVQLKCNCVSPQ